jgi:hypothetical protein
MTDRHRWPHLVVEEWVATRDTLHLYTQVVGKVRLANDPIWHHWWNTPLYVTATGLTTSLMPHPTGPDFQIDFDLHRHALVVTTVEGTSRSLDLTQAAPVATFHADVLGILDELGVGTDIWSMPVEIPGAIPFHDDHEHASYDPDAVRRFWLTLVAIEPVFKRFRSRFVGKTSPCTCSGARLTWPPPGSPDGTPRCTRVAQPTSAPT